MSPQDKVVDLIAKLLRKAHGTDNQHEAHAFATKAQEVALRHKLELSEIEWDEEAEDVQTVGSSYWYAHEHGMKHRRKRSRWRESLANLVAKHTQCAILIIRGSNTLKVVGAAQDRQVFGYLYGYLLREAEEMSAREANTFWHKCNREGDTSPAKGYRASWLQGFLFQLGERFAEMRDSIDNEYEDSKALVRLKDQLAKAEDMADELASGTAPGLKGRSGRNMKGQMDGRAAANRVNLNADVVGSGETKKQIK